VDVDGIDKEINDTEYGDALEGYDCTVTGRKSFGRVLEATLNVRGRRSDDYAVATARRPSTSIRCLSTRTVMSDPTCRQHTPHRTLL
jgi:hypothetical protein